MSHYRVCKLDEYQHYKDRSPPWIKLHRDMLTSNTWVTLDADGRVLAVACMLVAASTENKIPTEAAYMRRRAYLDKDPDFDALVRVGFVELVSDSNVLAEDRKQMLAPRKRPLAKRTECASEGEGEGETEQRRGEEKEARSRKTRIDPNFKATDDQLAYAKAQGCADPADTVERFKLHHGSKGTLHADWNLALQYWCRNEKNFAKTAPARSFAQQATERASTVTSRDDLGQWRQRLKGWRPGVSWWQHGDWGPEPYQPNCRVPQAILAEIQQ